MTIGQNHLKLNSAARRGYDLLLVARNRERMDDLAKKLAAYTRRKVEILASDQTDSNDLTGLERILRDNSRVTPLVKNADVITPIGGLIEVVK